MIETLAAPAAREVDDLTASDLLALARERKAAEDQRGLLEVDATPGSVGRGIDDEVSIPARPGQAPGRLEDRGS